MDKIICDVCGTSYPDSSSQCPICGYARPVKAKTAAQEDGEQSGGYVYVKGGRFSSTNVRKRNMDKGIALDADPSQQGEDLPKHNTNTVLGITAVVLLLALIAVLIFFIVKIAGQRTESNSGSDTVYPSTEQTFDDDEPVSCLELHTDQVEVTLSEAGDKWLIHASPVPADTTEPITYASLDPTIATVDLNGTVTAVSPGQTSVVVKCGEATLVVSVTCTFDDGSTWSLNRSDISLFAKGETWDLYSKTSTVAKNKIIWTSEDETVATVDGGIVTAVSSGVTTIYAEFNGTVNTCTIRCKLSEEDADTNNGEENTKINVDASSLKISHSDVTISRKESFSLTLVDANGNAAEVTWTASRDGYVSIDGNKITGVKSTANDFVTVSTTYEGQTYQCIVRVK